MPLHCVEQRRSPTQLDDEGEGGGDSTSIWQEAPDSILLHMFSFLEARHLLTVSEVCKVWNRVALDESLWRSLVRVTLHLPDTACIAPGRSSWRGEFKRVYYYSPTVLTETLTDHTDEVLHVSFAHRGHMFSTTSKDATLRIWSVGCPTTLKYTKDFRELLGWDFTQFSCFNESDTMVLVSSVKTTEYMDRRGYVAILSLSHGFEIVRMVTMDPSQLFGAWLDDTTFLGGCLEISLDRFATTVQIEAYDVPDRSAPLRDPAKPLAIEEVSGRPLFTFSSETASLIKFLTVANTHFSMDNNTTAKPESLPDRDSACSGSCEMLDLQLDNQSSAWQQTGYIDLEKQTVSLACIEKEATFQKSSNPVLAGYADLKSQTVSPTCNDNKMTFKESSDTELTGYTDLSPAYSENKIAFKESSDTELTGYTDLSPAYSENKTAFKESSDTELTGYTDLSPAYSENKTAFKESSDTELTGYADLSPAYSENKMTFKESSDTELTGYTDLSPAYSENKIIFKEVSGMEFTTEMHTAKDVSDCDTDKHFPDPKPGTSGRDASLAMDRNNFLTSDGDYNSVISSDCVGECNIYKSTSEGPCGDAVPSVQYMDTTHTDPSACAMSSSTSNLSTKSGASNPCKSLIFVTGEFAVALHQLGFKNVPPYTGDGPSGRSPDSDDGQEGYMVVNYSNNDIHIVRRLQSPDKPDNLIDLFGHVTGLCLSYDQRYLFINCRPWIGEVDRSDPWATPDLSPNIEIRVIDLLTMTDTGQRYMGHKGFSPSTMCCFVFLDVSRDYVASGSEDANGYLWDSHYQVQLANFAHESGVVNAVGFNPQNQEYLVTVSDDGTIKVWRSRHEAKLFHQQRDRDDN